MSKMTEKEFLINFAAFHKTLNGVRYEDKVAAVLSFCATNDPGNKLEMSGFLETLGERLGIVEYVAMAVDILTAD